MTPVAASDLMPDDIISWGYNMFLAEWCENEVLRQSAREVVRVYEEFTVQFQSGTREWWYCARVRGAANSLARGIARRKKTHAERVAAAEQEKASMVARLSESERWWGLLKGGIRLLLLGGFSYALVRAIFAVPRIAEQRAGLQEQYASIATALAIALIGSFLRWRLMMRRILGVFRAYAQALSDANDEYARSVLIEYRFTAESAVQAYEQLTGHKSPVTAGLNNLLQDLIQGRYASEPEPQNWWDVLKQRINDKLLDIVTPKKRTRPSRTPPVTLEHPSPAVPVVGDRPPGDGPGSLNSDQT
jgi:hypothetical protein